MTKYTQARCGLGHLTTARWATDDRIHTSHGLGHITTVRWATDDRIHKNWLCCIPQPEVTLCSWQYVKILELTLLRTTSCAVDKLLKSKNYAAYLILCSWQDVKIQDLTLLHTSSCAVDRILRTDSAAYLNLRWPCAMDRMLKPKS